MTRKQLSVVIAMGAIALFSFGNWLHRWYKPDGRLGPDEVCDVFLDLALNGLQT